MPGDLRTVDLTDLELWADGPPRELFARMRAEAPVRWNPPPLDHARNFPILKDPPEHTLYRSIVSKAFR